MTFRIMSGATKRIIQKRDTGEYYSGFGDWVSEMDQARHFESLHEALTEARQNDLPKGCCVLLLKFDGKEYDVELKI
jgi:hypothetical protein